MHRGVIPIQFRADNARAGAKFCRVPDLVWVEVLRRSRNKSVFVWLEDEVTRAALNQVGCTKQAPQQRKPHPISDRTSHRTSHRIKQPKTGADLDSCRPTTTTPHSFSPDLFFSKSLDNSLDGTGHFSIELNYRYSFLTRPRVFITAHGGRYDTFNRW
jgi:hypothetical protein